MRRFAPAILFALALPSVALAADVKFQTLAEKAVPLDGAKAVAALYWTATVNCAKAGDDMAQRQCEGIRASRAAKTANKTYIVDGDAGAFWIGEYDAKNGGVAIGVRGCIACGEAVDIGGERRYLVTSKDVDIKGGALKGPEVHKAFRKFPDEASARKWMENVFPRLRTQFVFKIPERLTAWQEGGAKGFAVEMVAFRVYDPCDGAMICSNPPSDKEKEDRTMCKGGEASGTDIEGGGEPKEPEVVKPKEPELPAKLTASDLNRAMKKAGAEVNACFATYGVPGTANLVIEVGGDGVVKKVVLKGDFEDTPTGDCIVDAVKKTEFPKFKSASQTFNYPFILR